jgi:hypothetical protein
LQFSLQAASPETFGYTLVDMAKWNCFRVVTEAATRLRGATGLVFPSVELEKGELYMYSAAGGVLCTSYSSPSVFITPVKLFI